MTGKMRRKYEDGEKGGKEEGGEEKEEGETEEESNIPILLGQAAR